MLRKLRRWRQKDSGRKVLPITKINPVKSVLQLENLEQRLLLSVAGWWEELGWRGASGGGITWDMSDDPGDSKVVLSEDGDPIVFWVEGTRDEVVDSSRPFSFVNAEMEGSIYARQFAGEDLGWWDFSSQSGDGESEIGTGGQIDVATGPNGEIAVTWVSGDNIYLKMWDGDEWLELDGSASEDGVSGEVTAEKPSVAISNLQEVFVSYTAVHPNSDSNQRDIVVMKYGYDYTELDDDSPDDDGNDQVGPPLPEIEGQGQRRWVELITEDVGVFGEDAVQETGGVSNDRGNSFDSSIAVGLDGKPMVVWSNEVSQDKTEIYLKSWDGDSWEELGRGSASDWNGDGNSGVSSIAHTGLQPDIAVAGDGAVVVTWVNWNKIHMFNTDGEAGVYVKVLRPNSTVWEEYAAGSASGAGIAQDADLSDGLAGLGWYFMPEVKLDSDGNPFVTWQGYGEGERYTASRVILDDGQESPRVGVYASYYNNGAFELLYDPTNVRESGEFTDEPRGVANEADKISWMPSGIVVPDSDNDVDEDDDIILVYTWHDVIWDAYHHDDSLYAQKWDADNNEWISYGRGSMSHGNDQIGGYPNSFENGLVQLAMVDHDNDASTEMFVMAAVPDSESVNGGRVYWYRRDTGTWTDDEDLSFGSVFDIKGEPETEYNIDGVPLLAYLDDNTLLPYVYEWVGGDWSLVGDGPAGSDPGNMFEGVDTSVTPVRDLNYGISVQQGPDGKILLVYLADNGVSDDAITRLWDPSVGSWEDVGSGGILTKTGSQEAVYFSNYDGYDWDVTGGLENGTYDDDGVRIYDLGSWNYWDITVSGDVAGEDDRVSGSKTDGAGKVVAGWADDDGNLLDDGMEIAIVVPAADEDDPTAAIPGTQIIGEVDHMFEIMDDGHVIVELDYQLDAGGGVLGDDADPLVNIDLAVYLVVDGTVVDANPYDGVALTPFDEAYAGEIRGYTDATSVQFDTKELGLSALERGRHTVGFRAVATVNNTDADPAAEQNGYVRFDNVGIYHRIVPYEYITGDDESQFTTNPVLAAGVPGLDDWGYTDVFDPSADVDGVWNQYAGRLGSDGAGGEAVVADGALVMTLGDGVNANGLTADGTALAGRFDYVFDLAEPGDIRLDFWYQLETGADIGDEDTLELIISLDGTDLDTDEYMITGGSIDTGWRRVTIEVSQLTGASAYASGNHTLGFRGVLSNSSASADGTASVMIDEVMVGGSYDFSADPGLVAIRPNVGGWSYRDVLVAGAAAGVYDGAEDVLEMTLGDGVAANGVDVDGTNIEGKFETTFTVPDDAGVAGEQYYVTLDLSYYLEMGSAIAADETVDLMISLYDGSTTTDITTLGDYRLEASGTAQRTRGWKSIESLVLGNLTPGDYTIEFRGILTNSAADANGISTVKIDDVKVEQFTGFGGWEFIPAGGDTGGNDAVGSDADGNPIYDFQADISLSLASAPGTQRVLYTVEDVEQGDPGPMVIMFRYRLTDDSLFGLDDDTTLRVLVDGVAYDSDDPEDRPLPLSYASNSAWFNGDVDSPEYTWVRVQAESISAGLHDVSIELVAEDMEGSLWIDNLVILASQPVNAYNPIATLAPGTSDDGTREFAIGVTNEAVGLNIYDSGATDFWPDGTVNSWTDEFKDAYYSANIYQLNETEDAWVGYGDDLAVIAGSVDFLGVGVPVEVPGSEMWKLEGLSVGPNQVWWVAMQRATTDWVDSDEDGVNDSFDIHPWNWSEPPAYWNAANTEIDIKLMEWTLFEDPLEVGADWEQGWEDVAFTPEGAYRGYTNIEFVSGANQLPTLAWTRRGVWGDIYDSAAQRYEGEDTWGILGLTESVQNGSFWSSTELVDMVVTADGDPVVGYMMGHLDSWGFREFQKENEIPSMTIEEIAGINDDLLDFGVVSSKWVQQTITISNSGPGELIIHDISIGGTGMLSDNPFEIINFEAADYPIVLGSPEEGVNSVDITVRLDPEGLESGKYVSVLLIHTNDINHPSHPFEHFYEMTLKGEVQGDAELEIEDQWLVFEDTIINGKGANDLMGEFQYQFTLADQESVSLDLDYQLLLGDRLVSGETMDLIVSVDDVDIFPVGTYQIVGGLNQDSGYQSITMDLGDLAAGAHILAVRGELSASLGGEGGIGTLRLDNIVVAGADIGFDANPGTDLDRRGWPFVRDTEHAFLSIGTWESDVGVTGIVGDGGLEMVLGREHDIEEVVIRNESETADLEIHEWAFDGTMFRILSEDADGVAGAFVSWVDEDGVVQRRDVSSVNRAGDDGVVLGPQEYLTLQIVFEPTGVQDYDETLYLRSSDSDEKYIAVRLTGIGIGANEIAVEVDGEILVDEEGEVDFGSVIRGEEVTKVITISNPGSTDLTIVSITENSPMINVSNVDSDLVLSPGESVAVMVTYSPPPVDSEDEMQVDVFESILGITSDAYDRFFQIGLTGRGVPDAPIISLVDATTGDEIKRLDFEGGYVGGDEMEETFLVKNVGGADLTLERFLLSFELVGTNPFTVSPTNIGNYDDDDLIVTGGGGSIPVTVTFTPQITGLASGELTIYYYVENDEKEVSKLRVTGSGSSQELLITDSQGDEGDGAIDFGSVGNGREADAHTITIRNNGTTELTITNWQLSDVMNETTGQAASEDVFSVEAFDTTAVTLSQGEAKTISVGFVPEAIASFSGTVTIFSDDPNNPVWEIDLSGDGVELGAGSLNKAEIDFGTVPYESRETDSFVITNNGDSDLLVSSVATTSSYFLIDKSALEAKSYIIGPNENVEIWVTFVAMNPFDSSEAAIAPVITVTTNDLVSEEDIVLPSIALAGKAHFENEANPKLAWVDDNGNAVQIVVSGGGRAIIVPVDGNLTGDIEQIQLVGTSGKSVLKVTGVRPGEEGMLKIGRIFGDSIKSIILKNVVLDGDLDDDGVDDNGYAIDIDNLAGTLQLGEVTGGADIYVDNVLGTKGKIKAGSIGAGTEIEVDGDMSLFQAEEFGGDLLRVNNLVNFKVSGGDFKARVEIAEDLRNFNLGGKTVQSIEGDFVIGGSLGKFTAKKHTLESYLGAEEIGTVTLGGMNGAAVSVKGELKKLTNKGDMVDSLISAGYYLGEDGIVSGDDILSAGGRLGQVTVTSRVSNSYLMAGIAPNDAGNFNVFGAEGPGDVRSGSIGKVKFGSLGDGNIFTGIAAHSEIGKVQLQSPKTSSSVIDWEDLKAMTL